MLRLFISQKVYTLTDKYDVVDEEKAPVYKVAKTIALGAKFNLYNSNGDEIFTIKKKVFAFPAEYHIFYGEKHYAKVKKESSIIRCIFNVTGDVGSYSIVGELSKKCF